MKNLKHFNTSRSQYSSQNNYSSFWLDNEFDRHTSIFDEEDVKPKTDLIALSSYRRAIANFVRIVTEKDIPVTFKSSGDSYTDGKKVVISAKMDDKSFDPSVGLALHEGSHIVHSDFDWLKNLEHSIREELFHIGETKGYSRHDIIGTVKGLLNYVEDRRIDNIIFTSSPGYKGYYHSMYDKYFHSKVIDKALGTDEYTDETMESYMFRIINLTNKNTNLSSLNGLREIWNTIDLKNISRLKDTEDAFEIAQDILGVIFKNLPDAEIKVDEDGEESYEPAKDSSESDMGGSGGSSDEPMSDEDFQDLLDSIESGEMKSQPKPEPKEEKVPETPSDKDLLSDSQKKQLENAIKKQKDFMNGKTSKKNVTKKELQDLQTIESSGMSYVEVGDGLKSWDGRKMNTKCIVVREFTKQLVDSNTISMINKWSGDRYDENVKDGYETDYIAEGIRLGTVLGRKLQVRGESRETKWTRLDSGRIDKRLVAELGFGNDRVFSNSFVEEYSDAFLHISVDASGSMSGRKWTNTMKSVVAMTKAIDMINNVDVVVSFRTTQTNHSSRTRRSDTTKPLILIAYDSRKDSFIKVKTLFKYLSVAGTTPEGLCYEAIMNDIVPSTNDKDSYFLNFSDGMPMFGNGDVDYHGDTALNHTAKMVKEIRNRGIKVLSYFVSDSDWSRDSESRAFKTMYGKDAEYIDITSVMSVSKTMNKKFLQK